MSPELVSVLIALWDDSLGRVTRAIAVCPIVERVFYAIHGKGSFLNGQPVDLAAKTSLSLNQAWINLNHYSDANFESDLVANARQLLRTKGDTAARMVTILPATSGVAFHILNGQMAAVIHDNDTRHVKQGPWDTAAIQLIVEEAGGVFLNGTNGKRYDTLNPSVVVIAASKKLGDQLIQIMHNKKEIE